MQDKPFQVVGTKLYVNGQAYDLQSVRDVCVEPYRRTHGDASWRAWGGWFALQGACALGIVLGRALALHGYFLYARLLYVLAAAAFVGLVSSFWGAARANWRFGVVLELETRSVWVYTSSNQEEAHELARTVWRAAYSSRRPAKGTAGREHAKGLR